MLTDHHPRCTDSDDYIREYVAKCSKNPAPKFYILLGDVIREDAPNVAVLHYDRPGVPVERIVYHPMAGKMPANVKLSGPRPLAAEGSRSNDGLCPAGREGGE